MTRLFNTPRLNWPDLMLRGLTSSALFVLVMAVFFFLRYDSPYFISNSLWAEDGPVFIEAGIAHPWASITTPYAGYLHLYPRLLSVVAGIAPVPYLPALFFAGWVAALLFLWHVLARGFGHCTMPTIAASAVLLGCLLQPHNGETFLALTNSQWWLAAALALMACLPQKFNSFYSIPALLLSLTGPFSILFLLPGWFQAVRNKSYVIALPLTVGAIIQVIQLLGNGRAEQALDPEIEHWLFNFSTFLLWGNQSASEIFAVVAFWAVALAVAIRGTSEYRTLIFCGVLAYASALYTMKGMPAALSPLGTGARYFVLPYTAVIVATFLNPALRRWQACIAGASLTFIFCSSPLKLHQVDTFYTAYAKLSRYEKTLSIPLAPPIPNSPGFALNVSANEPPIMTTGTPLAGVWHGIYQVASNACPGVRAAGFVVETNFPAAGYATLQWKDGNDTEYSSERRFYQAGPQRMQFAFTKNKKPVNVQFQAPPETDSSQIGKSYFLCLK